MAREEDGFFDDLARELADGTLTRGKALRLMGAALVGGTLGSLGIGEAGADRPGCKRAGKNCTRTDQCCGSLVCVSGTCTTTPPVACENFSPCIENPNPGCYCVQTVEGLSHCHEGGQVCEPQCTSTLECPAGYACVPNVCTQGPTCLRGCPSVISAQDSQIASEGVRGGSEVPMTPFASDV
jgi:hypothetical protein